ncbi:hypothetical protein BpHYR1_020709 [Brachionus plicatilis]|uniref:Uncharacterized protein n=1 Tax=Brachionus plicatilis TaxID=10195 RepID=A0A3M7PYS8_BRAPC|nr:hypothetical protein BpHYR1_020709 [Brachionus plicatilis]
MTHFNIPQSRSIFKGVYNKNSLKKSILLSVRVSLTLTEYFHFPLEKPLLILVSIPYSLVRYCSLIERDTALVWIRCKIQKDFS